MRFWKSSAYLVVEFDGYEQRFDVIDRDGRRLALDFDTTATTSKEPNQGIFTLYNLTESSRDAIASDARFVRCYAGYDGNEKLIFQGSIVFVKNLRSGPDWATTMQVGDGFAQYTQSLTTRSYASGTDREFILKQMASDMDLVVKSAESTVQGVLTGSASYDGKTKDTLDEFLKDQELGYSIQDGEIRVTAIGQPIDFEAIVLRADTGLLEHPVITEKGVNLRAQLNPDIRPGKLIKLEAQGFDATDAATRGKNYNGLYLCQSVKFVGNNYGGAFDVMIEAVAYG